MYVNKVLCFKYLRISKKVFILSYKKKRFFYLILTNILQGL